MYKGLILDIKKIAGKWLINGKGCDMWSDIEKNYFDHFLKHNQKLIQNGNIERVR